MNRKVEENKIRKRVVAEQRKERRDVVMCKYQSTESFQSWTQERSEKLEWASSTQLFLKAYQTGFRKSKNQKSFLK